MSEPVAQGAPDLGAVKQRQQQTWSSGDFHVVGARIASTAERLCDDADPHAGWRVLDVATGSGNAAIAAARLGCSVVGVDYVPELLERARTRAASEGLEIELVEGDAEALPFEGLLRRRDVHLRLHVRPRPRARRGRAAARLPAGRDDRARKLDAGRVHRRRLPHDGPTRAAAGRRRLAHALGHGGPCPLFGDALHSLRAQEEIFTWRFCSAEELVAVLRAWYGPTLKAFAALDEAGQSALEADLVALGRRWDRLGGDAIAVPSAYLEVIATRS